MIVGEEALAMAMDTAMAGTSPANIAGKIGAISKDCIASLLEMRVSGSRETPLASPDDVNENTGPFRLLSTPSRETTFGSLAANAAAIGYATAFRFAKFAR